MDWKILRERYGWKVGLIAALALIVLISLKIGNVL